MTSLHLLTFDFSFLFGETLDAPPSQSFLTSFKCLTHISTSLVCSKVCFVSCSVSRGISKSKTVKCSIPRIQIVAPEEFQSPYNPLPFPGTWGSQLTGTLYKYCIYVRECNYAIVLLILLLFYIYVGPGMSDLLKYRFSRDKKNQTAMEDVYDGALYKELSKPGGFLSDSSNISFLGNTDGVALVKSTGWSVWPVYLVINELPPLLRCIFSYTKIKVSFLLINIFIE